MNHVVPTGTVSGLANIKSLPIETTGKQVVSHIAEFRDMLKSTPQALRYTTWSLVNALNNSIIGNLQAHIRSERRLVTPQMEGFDQSTIDRYNEQQAALDELVASRQNSVEQGHTQRMSSLEVAEILVNIRWVFAKMMTDTAQNKRELPQALVESLAFRLRNVRPVDERKVELLHVLSRGRMPKDAIRKAIEAQQVSERQQLVDMAGEIADLTDNLVWKGVSVDSLEAYVDQLPVHLQYKLNGFVVRSIKQAMDAEAKALVRFNRLDAVTNFVLIESVLDAYKAYFQAFEDKHADALIEYEQNTGAQLPKLADLLADKS